MKANLPPYDDPDPWVWCRHADGGRGSYLRLSTVERWPDGTYMPRTAADGLRAIRGVTPEEMDARTRMAAREAPTFPDSDDTVRDRIADIREGKFPGG